MRGVVAGEGRDPDEADAAEERPRARGPLLALGAVLVLGLACALAGYGLGRAGGEDLSAAHQAGEAEGTAQGRARGERRGYEVGLVEGRREGGRQTTRKAD